LFQLTFFIYENIKKKRCWSCKSLNVIKWGKHENKQRFKCKNCGLFFTNNSPSTSYNNRKVWFKEWIIGRRTFKQLCKDSGYSERTLKRLFYKCLSEAPVFSVKPSEKVNLLIDGTYFSNNLCLVIYRDNTIKYTQLYRLSDGEWYEELKEDLENLLLLGVQIESITCDGHKALLKAIRKTCKHVIVQRCVIHIQRMCRVWLTIKPKSEAGTCLREIISQVHKIENHEQWGAWIVSLIKWYETYYSFIYEKSYNPATGRYWFKHKMVKQSFNLIRKALPNMFHYLDNPKIPKSTNGLESFFGHLKSHVTLHRGLSKEHRKSFIKWYLFYQNQ
jgi:hypothetical protein